MSLPAQSPSGDRRTLRVLLIVIAAVLVCYALQVPGPTRMMDDTVSYFLRAHQLLDGQGLASDNPRVRHPVGYSIVLAGMIGLGLDSVWWFIGLNVVSLIGALAFIVPLYRKVFGLSNLAIAWCTLFFLLSWTVVKHVPMLYSEMLFMALTLAILWLLSCGQPKSAWGRAAVFVLACVAILGLILIRTIGIAMLPVLAWYLLQQCGGWGVLKRRAMRDTPSKIVCAVLLLALTSGFVYKVATYDVDGGSRYVSMMVYAWSDRPSETATQVVDHRLLEFGKLTLNVPERALRQVMPGETWAVPVYIAGAVSLGLLAVGFWMQRRRLSLMHIYLLGFLALQLPWLSYDARFWLPVMPMLLPIMIAPLARVRLRWPQRTRWALAGYAVCFGAVGVLALGMSTRNTYAGRGYVDHDIWFPRELKVAYGLAEQDDFETLDLDAVDIIRRYDPYTPNSRRLTGVPKANPVNEDLIPRREVAEPSASIPIDPAADPRLDRFRR